MQLQREARLSLRKAYALGTFQNLNVQWVKYLKFCIYFEIRPFPASTVVLVWYSQFLTRSLKAHASIVAYLAGVKTLHVLLNFSIAGFHGFLLKLMLRGSRRNSTHVVHRAYLITPSILKMLHGSVNHDDPEQVVFWGIALLAFLLLFRKLNLVPDTVFGYDPHRQLRHADVWIEEARHRVVVGIRWAKNHQFTNELLTFPLPELPGLVLCLVKAIRNIRRLIPYRGSDHLFQLPIGGSYTYRRFQITLREKLKTADVANYSGYSSHSFRRGVYLHLFMWSTNGDDKITGKLGIGCIFGILGISS